jgi:RNA polymerase sigma-70 factor (ECF subfamily)
MDEQDLIRALKRGDPSGLPQLVVLWGDRLLRSAFLLCGNKTDAEDLVQDTFVEALRSGHRFAGRSSLYTWLHAILLNLARHHHRKRKRLVCDDDLARQDHGALTDDEPARQDSDLASASLAEALQRLSESHREVLILRFYEDMKIQDIARQLGLSLGTVKSRLHYAIAQMQKFLPAEVNLFGAQGTKLEER